MESVQTSGGRVAPWLARWGLPLCAVWGFAEATLFFIVPDAIVSAVALYHPRRLLRAAAAALAGALVGGALLFGAARIAGPSTIRVIDRVPAISTLMIERARTQIDERGGTAIVAAPAEGIPYKIYAAEWAVQDRSLWALLMWTVPARAIRFLAAGIIAALAGLVLRRMLPGRPDAWIAPHLVLWTAIYLAYFRTNGF